MCQSSIFSEHSFLFPAQQNLTAGHHLCPKGWIQCKTRRIREDRSACRWTSLESHNRCRTFLKIFWQSLLCHRLGASLCGDLGRQECGQCAWDLYRSMLSWQTRFCYCQYRRKDGRRAALLVESQIKGDISQGRLWVSLRSAFFAFTNNRIINIDLYPFKGDLIITNVLHN